MFSLFIFHFFSYFIIFICWKFQRLCGTYLFCYLICNNWSLIKKFILKDGIPSSKKVACISFNKKPFKMMKNVFYFLLKCLFLFLRYLNFCPDFFGYVKNGLMRKPTFQNLLHHRLGYKQLQNVYCAISHELKAVRRWNLFC